MGVLRSQMECYANSTGSYTDSIYRGLQWGNALAKLCLTHILLINDLHV